MIRPMVAETKRYGEYSKAGEFIYDHPFQWGSRRIGPDLAREGEKQSSLWHWLHFEDPERFPRVASCRPYEHLLSTEIDYKKITDRVWAAQMLGAEYDFELEEVPDCIAARRWPRTSCLRGAGDDSEVGEERAIDI
jgi:cytochrome c oxidase cbb3-type subunit I/II